MDDMKPNEKRAVQRTRVLRATDVMPPFDKAIPSPDPKAVRAETPQAASGPVDGPDAAVESLPVDDVEIPAYNLAENILAEQRRAAGRRRRGPGRVESGPGARLRNAARWPSAPNLATPDLLELQRIVAEIVARDIERLCQRSERPVYMGG